MVVILLYCSIGECKLPRIHIIGAPGSGKTTYARKLAASYNLPLFCLDDIYFDNSGKTSRKRSEVERTAMAQEFASTEDWISEGASFSDWINPVLKRATEIHIIAVSRSTCVYRQIKRYLKRKLGIEHSTHKETLKELWNVIKWTWHYNDDMIPIIIEKIPKNTKISVV